MIKLTQILLERIDYLETAKSIVKKYKLKSKVKFGATHDYGDYIPETDTILLNRSYPNVKEFVISVLHEIKHALDAKRLTPKNSKRNTTKLEQWQHIMVKTHMTIINGRS